MEHIKLETLNGEFSDVTLMRKENPLEWFEVMFPGKDCTHIDFDEGVAPEYKIITSSIHDGTLLFTHELIFQTLWPVVYKKSFSKKKPPPEESGDDFLKNMKYLIGDVHICDVPGKWSFGPVSHAVKEVVFLPVKAYFDEDLEE